ncbi:hypothetical protein MPLA_2130153 [Mesorhizobium sp. ORS 3359]|nr:hypothetical protein MPLA_2130153 [Mesorhizobium sp. ORS 3359]
MHETPAAVVNRVQSGEEVSRLI